MSYDLHVERPQGDAATQVRLLAANENENDKRLSNYLSVVHGQFDKKKQQLTRGKFNQLIAAELQRLRSLGIQATADTSILPPGSWFLQFTFTLAKPWMSKDDDPFYVTDSVNPVRKDKVFKVPMMSAASWKGLLRWTLMHTRLVKQKDVLAPQDFAGERFRQALLFGDEKGEEPGQTRDFAAFLDALKPEARAEYERLLRAYYSVKPGDPLPNHSGRLTFYPTFFNLIDVEVINPHSRKTKAGTHPIYLECVPAGAEGTFSLLYVPFDVIGQEQTTLAKEGRRHLRYVALAIRELMLIYGFSAKRTSGYGTARDDIQGKVQTRAGEKSLTHLNKLAEEVKDVAF